MKYTYTLQFGSLLITQAQSEQISRVLDEITNGRAYKDNFMDINASITHGTIRTMLHMLVISKQSFIAFCPECDKYVVSDNVNETVCAYDSVGCGDSHHIYKIGIKEVQCRMPDCSRLVKFITTNEDWNISREVTPDNCQITFFLHGTKSIRNSVVSHMQSLGGFAGVCFIEGCLCILVKVDQLKFEGDL